MKFERFNSDERQSLKLFHNRVGRIWATRIIKENLLGSEIKMTFHRNGEMKAESVFPSEDDLCSFLVHLRPFILQEDPIYYHKIIKILRGRLSIGGCCRICLNEYLSTININEIKPSLIVNTIFKENNSVKLKTAEYTSNDIFNLYLNGYYFHNDIQKLNKLNSFKSNFFKGGAENFSKLQLISRAIDLFSFVSNIDNLIVGTILADQDNTTDGN
jgi:hypothetical protein